MRLNKLQKYSIQWLLSQGNNVDQIAKELKIPSSVVDKFIKKNCQTNPTENEQTKQMSGPLKAKDLMIRQTASKGNNTVAVMTKEASQTSDAFRKSLLGSPQRYNNSIHKINGE